MLQKLRLAARQPIQCVVAAEKSYAVEGPVGPIGAVCGLRQNEVGK